MRSSWQQDRAWPDMKERSTEIFLTKTRDEWCEIMEGTDVCFAPVLTHGRGARAPAQRRSAAPSSRWPGSSSRPGAPLQPHAGEIARPPAHAGQHTDEVLAEWIGVDADRPGLAPGHRRHRLIGGPTTRGSLRRDGHPRLLPRPPRRRVASPPAGTMAQAARAGHRVVLVLATRGELGEVPEGFLDDGEQLWTRRVDGDARRRPRSSGVDRVEFLGYRDSGMAGEPTNDDPGSFWQADVERGRRTARRDPAARSDADVLIVYDDHGVYGHPDHIQVHRVGVRGHRSS